MTSKTVWPGRRAAALCMLLAAGLTACVTTGSEPTAPARLQPVAPQPAAASLTPGLTPHYFRDVQLDSIEMLMRFAADPAKGSRGKPILQLDANDGAGRLWEAQRDKFYGMRLDGMIRLEAGEYAFAASANDGERILIDTTRVADDPGVHGERLTAPVKVNVATPGWYPLTVWYFQKRGGASLQFYWQPPGAQKLEIVPASALAHR